MRVGFVEDASHLKKILRTFLDNGVKFCVNTDNPAMLKTTLSKEIEFLREREILSEGEIDQTILWALDASFIPTEVGKNLYL